MLRFAASPTGDMHIGSLRIAILNYLIAQQKNDAFLVRIDDTKKDENLDGKDTEIMQILEKFALTHESVFHQSEHLHMHQTLAIRLLEEGKAFVSTGTSEIIETNIEKLKADKTPFVIRVHNETKEDSFVILNEDGTPTPNFASACDDMISGINYILIQEDQLNSTQQQVYMKTLLGYNEDTKYVHIPVVTNYDEGSVKWLLEEGFIPDAIINYLLLLGNSKVPNETFTLPEAIEWFNIDTIVNNNASFDIEKLRFVNRSHIEKMDNKLLSKIFNFADESIGKLVKLYLTEVSTLKELKDRIEPIFAPKNFDGKWKEEMETLRSVIEDSPMINDFDEFKSYIAKNSGLKEKDFMTPLRLILTGKENGPELEEIYPLIKSYILEVAS